MATYSGCAGVMETVRSFSRKHSPRKAHPVPNTHFEYESLGLAWGLKTFLMNCDGYTLYSVYYHTP